MCSATLTPTQQTGQILALAQAAVLPGDSEPSQGALNLKQRRLTILKYSDSYK